MACVPCGLLGERGASERRGPIYVGPRRSRAAKTAPVAQLPPPAPAPRPLQATAGPRPGAAARWPRRALHRMLNADPSGDTLGGAGRRHPRRATRLEVRETTMRNHVPCSVRRRRRLLRAGLAALVFGLAGAGLPSLAMAQALSSGAGGVVNEGPSGGGGSSSDPFGHLPGTMVLDAVIRDVRPGTTSGGHPDFETFLGEVRLGLLRDTLDENGKPVLSGNFAGTQLNSVFRDSSGRAIMPAMYDPARGDTAGSLQVRTDRRVTSFDSFRSWYNDVEGVNQSTVIQLTLKRVPGTSRFVFDSAVDEPYRSLGGFFAINGQLWGDSARNRAGLMSNFFFTTEVSTIFTYKRGQGLVFTFTGDDDVWVFIGGRLAIDLGGVHPRREQSVELDRLSWLEDGKTYKLLVFHAERHTTESNFRIETNLLLAPSDDALFD
ncbi:MAG: hypothetical protein C0468_00780 [Planctomyces sp.]|nr:hypothetical protein [Planctomyces sp.]